MSPAREEVSSGIDWWPFTRLLITGAVLGLSAHYYLGWRPDLRALARLTWNVFEILSFAALIAVMGHPGWDPSPETRAKYALVVSFEAVNRDLPIYTPIRTAIELPVEVEIQERVVIQDSPRPGRA